MSRLSDFQKKLCGRLQNGLPICERPFDAIAGSLDSSEQAVVGEVRRLKLGGQIRRISAIINYRTLGFTGTLVTAHAGTDRLEATVRQVNGLDGVSHNYLRRHYFNLWFTLQGKSKGEIDAILAGLSERCGVEFHSLPVERVFKLDVRFDLENEDGVLVCDGSGALPREKAVELSERERLVLSRVQDGFEVETNPLGRLCGKELDLNEVLDSLCELRDKGVIRRISAVLDYRKLGFTANAMLVTDVPQERIVEIGGNLAGSNLVSHCYQRRMFEGWRYNVFAMMHGRSMGDIERAAGEFAEGGDIKSYALLVTEAELKKQPVRHRFV